VIDRFLIACGHPLVKLVQPFVEPHFFFFVETVDPSWPRVVLSGNLPRLQLHFNEEKVFTLKHFINRLLGPELTGNSAGHHWAAGPAASDEGDGGGGAAASGSPVPPAANDETLALFNDWQPKTEVDLSARLFVAQFSVSDLSVEIQSQVS
jgi:hypothetical protein